MTDAQDPTAQPPPTAGEALPCLVCGKESVWTSPTGHRFCQECRDIYTDIVPQQGLQPVDIDALLTGEQPPSEWLVEPILPAGKLCGIIAKRGDGKSLLLLDIAAAKATGAATLLQPPGDPISTVYIDMEMGPEDLYDRLTGLGYNPEHPRYGDLLNHLHYYQLVALPPLDTEAGGTALEELVIHHDAKLVVVDTVSRVVSGEENAAEPYRDMFRHTETRLKRRRVTLARLDHLGKDKERGSRGSSAKEDPLDVVWQLTISLTGTLEMALTKGRQEWLPRHVTIHRDDHDGVTVHSIHDEPASEWVVALAERIEGLGLPLDLSSNKVLQALKEDGKGARKSTISQAMAMLRKGSRGGYINPVTPLLPPLLPPQVTTGDHLPETQLNIEELDVTTPGNRYVTSDVSVTPLKGVTTQEPDTFEPSLDDLDYLADLAEEDL